MKEKRIGFPHMGKYIGAVAQVVNTVLEEEGLDHINFVPSPPTTKETILRGWQLMDENMCLPAKITLGNILDSIEENNITGYFMWDSCGDCRYKVYHLLHKRILDKLGYKIKMYPFRARHAISDLRRIDGISSKVATKILWKALKEIWRADRPLLEKQASLKRPKVGVVGEIYTILEPNANLNILKKLKEQGASIHNSLPLTEFVFKKAFHKSWIRKLGFKRPDLDYRVLEEAKEEAEEYLPRYTVGGHGKESIINTLYYAKKGFDAVVHIQPFPCMPESTVSEFLDQISEAYGIPLNHFTFDQQFGEENLNTRVEALVKMLNIRKELKRSSKKIAIPKRSGRKLWMGIDVGSVSTKGVVLNQNQELEHSFYLDTARDPIKAIQKGLKRIKNQVEKEQGRIINVATTGSGRELAAAIVQADLVLDEISSQTLGCLHYFPNIREIIEIGGQDSKFVQLRDGVPVWFNLNSICSAGTGSFFSGAAREFELSIEEFAEVAKNSDQEVKITGRCGVFAESDLVTKQQQGYGKKSLIRGMCTSMPQNYLQNVARNKKMERPLFTGGVALNQAVKEGFERRLGVEVKVHPYPKVSGAIGACLYAQKYVQKAQTNFAGFKIAETSFQREGFECEDCANQCSISLILREGEVIAVFGSKCQNWNSKLAGKKNWRSIIEKGL